MKKIFLPVLLIPFLFPSQAFALDEETLVNKLYSYLKGTATPPHGEIDILVSFDPLAGVAYTDGTYESGVGYSSVPDASLSFGAEYIVPVTKIFRLGAGAQYLMPRKADGYESSDGKISYVPVYAIIQANPFWFLPGVFFKVNAGYSFFFFENIRNPYARLSAAKNGLTWGAAAGVNITKNWSVEVSYNKYYSTVNINWPDGEYGGRDMTLSKLGITAMYRIKL